MENNKYSIVLDSDIINKPIEYKTLDESDFDNALDVKKDLISVPDGKYLLSKEVNLISKISPWEESAVVVNASVGQGKSHLAVEIAKRYYLKGHTIIFAVPHKSLITEYIRNVKYSLASRGLNTYIPDYESFEYVDKNDKSVKNVRISGAFRIHVMTINCLLGNPGDFTEQATLKRFYIDNIIASTKKRRKKVILLFDEIHDGVHNFKPNLILNLWKFVTNNVLLKSFIFSATFTEASKVVIKYIAELTNKKLHIIETERNQYINNLSNLHLHITSRAYYDFNDDEMRELFEKIIDSHDSLDIVTFSKKIAIDLTDDKSNFDIKKMVVEKFESINLCIAKENLERLKPRTNDFKNVTFSEKYKHDKCNIGTMFKTGVSILKNNSALVVFLPTKFSMQKSTKDYGIFNDGIISLIQTLARVRKKSDIYIIMPEPNYLISGDYWDNFPSLQLLDDLVSKSERLFGSEEKKDIKNKNQYSYKSIEEQFTIISDKYSDIYSRVEEQIEFVKLLESEGQRYLLPPLLYTHPDIFRLNEGESFLSNYYAIFGRDLPAYILWAAFNNQFVNCKLKSISANGSRNIIINEGEIQENLYSLFNESFNGDFYNIELCDYDIYTKFCEKIFFNKITYNGKKITRSDERFQGEIMSFLQKIIKGNIRLNKNYTNGQVTFVDIPFKEHDYLLCSMANAMQYNSINTPVENTTENNLISVYQALYKVRQLYIDKLVISYNNEIGYIYPTFQGYTNNPFTAEEIKFILHTVGQINKDIYFRYLRKNGIDLSNRGKALNTIYNLLKNTFFETEEIKPTLGGRRVNIRVIKRIIELPTKRTGLNLLYIYDYVKGENYEDVFLESIEQINVDEYNVFNWDNIESVPITENDITINEQLKNVLEYHNEVSLENNIIEETKEETAPIVSDKKNSKEENDIEYYDGDVIMKFEDIEEKEITENDIEINLKIEEMLKRRKNGNTEE